MKKIFALLFAAILLTGLPACNEDNTENDAAYTAQLIGSWVMNYGNSEYSTSHYYNFEATKFTYTYTTNNLAEFSESSWTIKGTWNVKQGILQLYFDIDSYRAEGYTESEMKSQLSELISYNDALAKNNKKGRAFGPEISFKTVNDETVLQLKGANGYFKRVSY